MNERFALLITALAIATCANGAETLLAEPSGFYVMQAVDRQNVDAAILKTPRITGLHLRSKWAGQNIAFLKQQAKRVADAGKHYTAGVYAGVNSAPSFVDKRRPWLATSQWTAYVAMLGKEFNSDPCLDAWHMSAPVTNDSMELYLPPNLAPHSDEDIVKSWQQSIDAFAAAFPSKTLVLDLAMIPDSRGRITQAVDEYARRTLGDRYEAIVCNLKANTSISAPHIKELMRQRREGVRIGFEMACPSSDRQRFGGSFEEAMYIGRACIGQWYQIYQSDVQNIPLPSRILRRSATKK